MKEFNSQKIYLGEVQGVLHKVIILKSKFTVVSLEDTRPISKNVTFKTIDELKERFNVNEYDNLKEYYMSQSYDKMIKKIDSVTEKIVDIDKFSKTFDDAFNTLDIIFNQKK